MMLSPAVLSMPFLRRLEPERAHRLAVGALRFGLGGHNQSRDDPVLGIHAFGIQFSNPIGLAAGFDKDATALPGSVASGLASLRLARSRPARRPAIRDHVCSA